MTVDRGKPVNVQVADATRADIRTGTYPLGSQLPSERELAERFEVSGTTIRAAMATLRAEGLVVSHAGRPARVTDHVPLIRTGADVTKGRGFYDMMARAGVRPATITTVDPDGQATPDAADTLGVPVGSLVVIRRRLMRGEGMPPLNLATSYFPPWVVEAAPALADPDAHGMPETIRDAFGETYSEDRITARRASEAEAKELEVEPGSPVVQIKGLTRDYATERALHYIDVVIPEDRMPVHYRY